MEWAMRQGGPSMTMEQARKAATPTGRFGLFDEVDALWVGNQEGPLRYDNEVVARLAAEVACRMVGWPLTRIRARLFDRAGKIRDEVKVLRPRSRR